MQPEVHAQGTEQMQQGRLSLSCTSSNDQKSVQSDHNFSRILLVLAQYRTKYNHFVRSKHNFLWQTPVKHRGAENQNTSSMVLAAQRDGLLVR